MQQYMIEIRQYGEELPRTIDDTKTVIVGPLNSEDTVLKFIKEVEDKGKKMAGDISIFKFVYYRYQDIDDFIRDNLPRKPYKSWVGEKCQRKRCRGIYQPKSLMDDIQGVSSCTKCGDSPPKD